MIRINPRDSLFAHRQALLPILFVGLAAACLLGGYEFIRSPSNSLFLKAYGKENLPLIQAIMPIGVIAIIYLYARLLTWLGPRRTMFVTSVGSSVAILGCWAAIEAGIDLFAGVLYIVREAYVILLIEQYWSLLNSCMDDATARRLNGPVCGISSIGAIFGGFLLAEIAPRLGTGSMLLFAAGACIPAAVFSDMAYRRVRLERAAEVHKPEADQLGVSLFRKHHVLFLITALVLLTQLVSTVSGLAFQGVLYDTVKDIDQQTAWQGNFYGTVNTVAAVFQFILAPLLLKKVRMALIHLAIPLIQLGTFAYALWNPGLLPAALAFLTFKVFDYSLFRAAKELLYIPLPFDARYRAKEVIDVFGYRFGKGGSSLIITMLQKKGGFIFTETIYTTVALVAVGFWTLLVLPFLKKESRRSGSTHVT